MKLITYPHFGIVMPDAVADYIDKNGLAGASETDFRANKNLIAFIEAFKDHKILDRNAFHTSQANEPLSLFYSHTVSENDILKDVYYGYCTSMAMGIPVTINTYNETKTRVMIQTIDKKETLVKVPEYTPVDGIPGLYEQEEI